MDESLCDLILTLRFPNHWKDLTLYKLLIIRLLRQFNGHVWLTYDQAFRKHEVTTKLVDCSAMNVQWSYFHSAGSSVGGGLGKTNDELKEPSGAASSQIVCRSNGNVGAVVGRCRFAHYRSRCTGP